MPERVNAQQLFDLMRENLDPLETDYLPLRESRGRVLAESLTLTDSETIPRVAAQPGYGVRYVDVQSVTPDNPQKLKVVQYHPNNLEFILGKNKAIEVEQGLTLPNGCDTVIPPGAAIESDRKHIQVRERVEEKGSGTSLGEETSDAPELAPGTRLDLPLCLALAELGTAEVPVHRSPTLGHLTLGDEWVDIRVRRLEGGRRRNILPLLFRELGQRWRIPVLDLGKAEDDSDLSEDLQGYTAQVDLLVLAGDAHRGRDALESSGKLLGVTSEIPGAGDFAFGIAGRVPVVVLPTDSEAAVMTVVSFLRTAVELLSGERLEGWPGQAMDMKQLDGDTGKGESRLVPVLRNSTGGFEILEYGGDEAGFWRQDERADGVVLVSGDGAERARFFEL